MFLKKLLHEGLEKVQPYNKKNLKLLFSEHHLSHAASAFYSSPFQEAAILTIDGVGEWATASICHGKDNKITMLKEMKFPHSVGLLYSAFTYYLGFRVNSGEYKLMGLAPYGNPESDQTTTYRNLIKDNLVSIKDDGSIWVNQAYFNYSTGQRMIKGDKFEKLFGLPVLEADGQIDQRHCNMALAIQQVTEEIVLKMAREAKRITGSDNLTMAGGVALNCVANGKLLKEKIFQGLFIQPASGDAGGSLGAALMANYMYFDQPRVVTGKPIAEHGFYLGPDFSEKEAILSLKKHKAVFHSFEQFDALCHQVADLLDRGNVIGWFQGRMEFGPRSLGNRSILGDARNTEMQKKLNLKIKYREGFRPFAPSVLYEDTKEYFDLDSVSPYMLLIADLNKDRQNILPDNYHNLDLMERLYFQRSDIPSITHLDFSARIQTVHKEINPRYWQLINAFKEKTGYGLLVNTSFNVRGEPVVCTPEDAYKCFMRTEMDYLVIDNLFLVKTEQPDWENREKWMEKFKLD